ncbi:hypothetical protein BGX29_004387, partial [Mortierella sp. GBA35]
MPRSSHSTSPSLDKGKQAHTSVTPARISKRPAATPSGPSRVKKSRVEPTPFTVDSNEQDDVGWADVAEEEEEDAEEEEEKGGTKDEEEDDGTEGTNSKTASDKKKTDWLVVQLCKPDIYLVLQGRNPSTTRKTPQSTIHKKLAKAFTARHPKEPPMNVNPVKNKIA